MLGTWASVLFPSLPWQAMHDSAALGASAAEAAVERDMPVNAAHASKMYPVFIFFISGSLFFYIFS